MQDLEVPCLVRTCAEHPSLTQYPGNTAFAVASFFRDPAAWDALRRCVIGPLVESATAEQPIRAWVIGCSTGEEAYTLGIALDEEFEKRKSQRNYTVFASDLDESALLVAGKGIYPPEISADVSVRRVERYFRQHSGSHQVIPEIRQHIIFSYHDVLKDFAVPRLDLIICRNVLTFVEPQIWERLLGTLYRACRDQGYAFLGVSERANDVLFRVVDAASHIYRARPRSDVPRIGPEMLPDSILQRAQRLQFRRPKAEFGSASETAAGLQEELQSIDEELRAVSDELKAKLEDLSHADNDLSNLMTGSEVGVAFFDRSLQTRRVTSRFAEIVGVPVSDCNQSSAWCARELQYPTLEDDARRVLVDGVSLEREITRADGHAFAVRIRPYRSVDGNETQGVVVALQEVTALKRVQSALFAAELRVAAELNVMRILHQMTITAAAAATTEEALEYILAAAIQLQGANLGNIQLLDEDTSRLRIIAQKGFDAAFLLHFEWVSADDGTACSHALQSRQTLQISDIPSDPRYQCLWEIAAHAGYRAVQSTPLISRSGTALGVLSIHFHSVHAFSQRDRELGELLGRQAADLIEYHQQRQRVAQLEGQLRHDTRDS